MDNPKKSRFRLVYRRSSLAVKCVVLVSIVLLCAALIIMSIAIKQENEKTEQARLRAADQELENSRLQNKIDNAGTQYGYQSIAKDELGLVDPDTVIVETVYTTGQSSTSQSPGNRVVVYVTLTIVILSIAALVVVGIILLRKRNQDF